MNAIYERKISFEEARSGYFLVSKNRLLFFPEVGSPFSIKIGTKKKRAKVESRHCECQGPELPHEHYFVQWKGLAEGDHVVVKKDEKNKNLFSIRIEE